IHVAAAARAHVDKRIGAASRWCAMGAAASSDLHCGDHRHRALPLGGEKGHTLSAGLPLRVRHAAWLPALGAIRGAAAAARPARRVIVRVAMFRAQAFHELERLARAVPWERFVEPGAPVRFRVTSRKSRLYHTGAIEQRVAEAIEHRLGTVSIVDPGTPSMD